jgi:hypothetical protein
MPEYHELVLRDALLKKLREDYGAGPPRKAKPPAADKAPKKPGKDEEPAEPPAADD